MTQPYLAYVIIDIHTKNIASHIPNLDSWTVEQIYECLGKPSKATILRLDNQPLGPEAPPYSVEPACFWSLGEETLTKQIRIIDFGEASFSSEDRKKLHTPMPFRAPESFFGENVGTPADIWAFACTIFDLFGKAALFEAFMPDKDRIIAEMVSTLGPLPERWWEKWENRGIYFSRDGARRMDSVMYDFQEPKPLALRIREIRPDGGGGDGGHGEDHSEGATTEHLSNEDLAGLQRLLATTLKYCPAERATAEDVVNFEWIQQQFTAGRKS